jgi:D-inositol-3-phosphate glycosyltransferase
VDGAARVRVLLASHYALPHLGGIEVIVDAMARELVRRGHDVVHLASDARNAGPVTPDPAEYRLLRLPASNWLERRFDVPWPVFGPALAAAVRREVARADVVHAHGFLYMPTLAAFLIPRRGRGRPVRVLTEHVHHVEYQSRALDAAQALAIGTVGRFAARAADQLTSVNPRVTEALATLAPGVPVELIPNGVDVDRHRPLPQAERAALRARLGWDERPRVLFVGRLVAKKGVEVALEAAAHADGTFRLLVVGPGELDAPPPDGVDVLGPLAPERVRELYQAADAFLLPSRGEGFPVTAQEAMASGLPVVLGDDPAYAPNVAGAGDGVHLVDPDGAAVVEALAGWLQDPARRASAGALAAAHARRRFSWAAQIVEHERLYERLLGARGVGAVR